MLAKIVLACGLSAEKEARPFAVGNIPVAIAAAARAAGLPFCVVYGLSPKQVGAQWGARAYEWMADGETNWCFAERLEVINADPARKRQLWSCLKRIKEEAS